MLLFALERTEAFATVSINYMIWTTKWMEHCLRLSLSIKWLDTTKTCTLLFFKSFSLKKRIDNIHYTRNRSECKSCLCTWCMYVEVCLLDYVYYLLQECFVKCVSSVSVYHVRVYWWMLTNAEWKAHVDVHDKHKSALRKSWNHSSH